MPPCPAPDLVPALLDRYDRDPGNLLQILIEIQEACHCVPGPAMAALGRALCPGDRLRIPALVDFYSFLSADYLGDYVIRLSDNITDQMLGSRALMDQLGDRLRLAPGQTRADGRVSLHFASCIGMADQGPAALVNGRTVTRLDRDRVGRMAELIESGTPLADWPGDWFRVEPNLRRCDALLRPPLEPGAAIRACLERGAAATLEEIERSGLRGRGGAGFSTARKWQAARAHPAPLRHILCNADEGEPGAFKDRLLLQSYPDLVIEGMTVAALAVGARSGRIYLRGEYRFLGEHLAQVLARRRAAGLLGGRILGADLAFDIQLHWGAGAYICGMETAMIESLEGRRGIPRRKYPLPVAAGYQGRPSVVNNVETFAAAAQIGRHGGAGFARQGTRDSTGTKLFSVSGDCARPGIYEYPWGISCRELLRDCGARDSAFLQVGGPSGNTVPEPEFDRRMGFEDLGGVGTVMVFDRSRRPLDMTRNFARFFQHECCGLCTPCRLGTTLLVDLLEKFEAGRGSPADLEEIRGLAAVMANLSHCGLGATAPLHFLQVMAQFPEALAIAGPDFQPAPSSGVEPPLRGD